jgi:hypothetical protein
VGERRRSSYAHARQSSNHLPLFSFSHAATPPSHLQTPRYTVTGLTPGTAYEVRVSHPSTVPAVVGIAIETSVGLPRTSPLGRELRRRSLLDTTRAALALGANDQPLSVIVTVNATSRGFYPPGRGGGPPPALPVAITVERLVGGFLPADARPVVCVCAVLMAAVLVAVPAWADGGVRRVGEWLDGGHHRPEEEEDEVEGKAR